MTVRIHFAVPLVHLQPCTDDISSNIHGEQGTLQNHVIFWTACLLQANLASILVKKKQSYTISNLNDLALSSICFTGASPGTGPSDISEILGFDFSRKAVVPNASLPVETRHAKFMSVLLLLYSFACLHSHFSVDRIQTCIDKLVKKEVDGIIEYPHSLAKFQSMASDCSQLRLTPDLEVGNQLFALLMMARNRVI